MVMDRRSSNSSSTSPGADLIDFDEPLLSKEKRMRFFFATSSLASFDCRTWEGSDERGRRARAETPSLEKKAASSGVEKPKPNPRPTRSLDVVFFKTAAAFFFFFLSHTSSSPLLHKIPPQLTIYDDCHFSDYVAVVAQFNSERTAAGAAGGDLAALAWVAPARARNNNNAPSRPDSAFDSRHDASGSAVPDAPTATDALVAVAGASGQVSVVSVSQCAVVALLGDAGTAATSSSEAPPSSPDATAAAATAPSTSTSSSRLPPVVALAGAPGVPGLLAALDARGVVTLWDCLSGRPLASQIDVGSDALSLALSPDGRTLATGHRGGSVRTCPVPEELVARCGRQPGLEGGLNSGCGENGGDGNDGATADGDKTPLPPSHPAARPQPALPAAAVCERVDSLTVEVAEDKDGGSGNGNGASILPPEFRRRRAPHSAPVESVKFLSRSRLASKASDGSVVVLELSNGGEGQEAAAASGGASSPASVVASFRVPGCGLGGLGGASARSCALAATRDGAYVATGTPSGEVHVFEAATGRRAGKVGAAPRLKEAVVRGVALSDDCRHLVVAAGVGFVFRFEARAAAPAVVEVAATAAVAAPEQQQPAADAS